MKRVMSFILILLLIVLSVPMGSFADTNQVLVEKKNHLLKDYLPLRETFEGLGYSVVWQSETRMVEIIKNDQVIYFRADEKYFLKNGVLTNGLIKPLISNGKMYVSVAAMNQVFEHIRLLTATVVQVTDVLKLDDGKLPKLSGQEEYELLLSFYPIEDLYYRYEFGGLEDGIQPAADTVMEAATESDVSQTNNQVEGVDESDIVKLDNDYIYSIHNQTLQIIKTGRGQLEVLYTIEDPNFYPQQLFITQDKLILIGQEQNTDIQTYEDGNRIMTIPIRQQNTLMVKVYTKEKLDIKAPKHLKSYGVEGNLLSARLVGDFVYLVANQYQYYGEPIVPMLFEQDGLEKVTSNTLAVNELAYFPGHVNHSMMYTMGIDLNNLTLDGLDIDAYVGGGTTLYADSDSLYIALQSNSGMWWREWTDKTDIFSFELQEGQIEYKSKGEVPGSILNQFAMDEFNGSFRIATTKWGIVDENQGSTSLNNLYILDGNLNTIGKVENLAPGERIYSTRMLGDKVYIVTYRQVDPFYVIDVTNPSNPNVLGYLKIPGYSSYLHPFDENTIIGIGMETKEIENRVVNDGVKISLFDVSDFSNPVEKDKKIIGTGNTSTEVTYDHKAFLFNQQKNILALPVMTLDISGNYSKDAYIFNFTDTGMLNFKGAITHGDLSSKLYAHDSYDAQITRILYDLNDLYTISNGYVKLNDFETLEEVEQLKR